MRIGTKGEALMPMFHAHGRRGAKAAPQQARYVCPTDQKWIMMESLIKRKIHPFYESCI
jgi:hypothetical protein